MKDIPPKPPQSEIPSTISGELSAANLSIFYVMLVHDKADFAQRIIRALMEPQHTFVIHVDLKSKSVFNHMKKFAAKMNENSTTNNIFLVDKEREQVQFKI